MSEETLQYPAQIAKEIGIGVNELNRMKARGCPFYGRKTCVKWVRAYLAKITGAESLLVPVLHHQRLAASISGAPVLTSDSPTALLRPQTARHDGNE